MNSFITHLKQNKEYPTRSELCKSERFPSLLPLLELLWKGTNPAVPVLLMEPGLLHRLHAPPLPTAVSQMLLLGMLQGNGTTEVLHHQCSQVLLRSTSHRTLEIALSMLFKEMPKSTLLMALKPPTIYYLLCFKQ